MTVSGKKRFRHLFKFSETPEEDCLNEKKLEDRLYLKSDLLDVDKFDASENPLDDDYSPQSEDEIEAIQSEEEINDTTGIESENEDENEKYGKEAYEEGFEHEISEQLTDLASLKARIERLVHVLTNFSSERDPSISRSQYVDRFIKDIALYYGYNEFLIRDYFFHMFPVVELIQFLEASDQPRPVTIRTNTLKIKRRKDLAKALIAKNINVDPLAIGTGEDDSEDKDHSFAAWSSLGLQVFDSGSGVSLGSTSEYLAGLYMLQAAVSFLPVVALAPRPDGRRILDMCSAPGGKATHCAQLMQNTGILIANDISKERQKATIANIYRLGVRNTIVTAIDGRKLTNQFSQNFFDGVLLDAPCSGTGVISKDPSVKVSKEEKDFSHLTHLQKELILTAIDLSSETIVYSTCSVCVEENEQVVQYALEKRPNVRLVPTGIPFGRPGFTSYRGKRFHPSMKLAMRYYPHVHNLDGFFVAKFAKIAANKPTKEPLGSKHEREKAKSL